MNLQEEAELAIGRILGRLEFDTGDLVESLSIHRIEVTNINDTRQQFMCRVIIELRPRPGQRWPAGE